jgi:hypothetical protein
VSVDPTAHLADIPRVGRRTAGAVGDEVELVFEPAPVRRYTIAAVRLDKTDPSKVLARSREPPVRPEPSERQGYVPNMVYPCGAMRHDDLIILPDAASDTFLQFRDHRDCRPDPGHGKLILIPSAL